MAVVELKRKYNVAFCIYKANFVVLHNCCNAVREYPAFCVVVFLCIYCNLSIVDIYIASLAVLCINCQCVVVAAADKPVNLVGLVISIYLLSGRRLLSSIFGKLVTAILPTGGVKRVTMFIKRLYSNLTEFLSARILSALFLGIAAYLLFWAAGIPYYALLALIIVVCNLFPVFGTIFSMMCCGVVILVTRPGYTLPMLGILIALELFDNFLIEPRTIHHKALRPNVGTTIVLLLCGYALFGLVGAMIAIPVFATVQNALRAFTVHLLNRRHLPTVREDYQSFDMREHMPKPEEGTPGTEEAAAVEPTADTTADATDTTEVK